MKNNEMLTPYQYGQKACREISPSSPKYDQGFIRNYLIGKNEFEIAVLVVEWKKGYTDEQNRVKELNERVKVYKNSVLTPMEYEEAPYALTAFGYGQLACKNMVAPLVRGDIEFWKAHLSGGKGDQEVYVLTEQWYKGYESALAKREAESEKLEFRFRPDDFPILSQMEKVRIVIHKREL